MEKQKTESKENDEIKIDDLIEDDFLFATNVAELAKKDET